MDIDKPQKPKRTKKERFTIPYDFQDEAPSSSFNRYPDKTVPKLLIEQYTKDDDVVIHPCADLFNKEQYNGQVVKATPWLL